MKKILTLLTAGALSLFSSVHAHQLWSLEWHSNSADPYFAYYSHRDGDFGGFIDAGINNIRVFDYITNQGVNMEDLWILRGEGLTVNYASRDKDVMYDFYVDSHMLTQLFVSVMTRNLASAKTIYVNYTVKSNGVTILTKRGQPLQIRPGMDSTLNLDWTDKWNSSPTGPHYDISISFLCDDNDGSGSQYLIGIRKFEAYGNWNDVIDEG